MASVALVVHRVRPEAVGMAQEAASWLRKNGHEVRMVPEEADHLDLRDCACEPEKLAAGLDLAVSLGGDGTMLRTVELVAKEGVPVLGVNAGHLGYLTEIEPAQLPTALERFLSGAYEIEERMMLAVSVESTSGSLPAATLAALNEAVIEKAGAGHTIHAAVSINDTFFTTYAADGLIVATPTGSTAYAFSVRGPIVSPRQRALILTPVSPHMLFDRSLVLDEGESVRIELIDDRPAILTVDGRELGTMRRGDAIACSAAPYVARFVTFEPRDFFRIVKTKFGLADR
ncbi:MAG TPA: NAD(+)/NADH kinase [Acidimicrobiales bacterium]|nr:NAD(+)/NADH kinase [Acidimicrobiales bacterium]